jgi:hypothetical protein
MHFKYFLAAGLRKNISLRQILFVNPNLNDGLKARAKKLLRQSYIDHKRIVFSTQSFEQFASLHPADVSLKQFGRPIEYGLQYDFWTENVAPT